MNEAIFSTETRKVTDQYNIIFINYEKSINWNDFSYIWCKRFLHKDMFVEDTRIESLLSYLEQKNSHTLDGYVLLLAEKDLPKMEPFLSTLKERGIKVCGGIFPALLFEGQKREKGAIIQRFPLLGDPFVLQVQKGNPLLPESFSSSIEDKTAIVWADGLSGYTSDNLNWLYSQVGESTTFLGGGAGFMSFQQAPCVFTEEGIYQDALVGMVLDKSVRVGVSHGWKKIIGPLVATKTRKNVIHELNWEPALEVYRRNIEADGGGTIGTSKFFEIAQKYPFGIYRSQTEQLVRDPLGVGEGGSIVCAGEVPENAVLHILRGEGEELIQAAQHAALACQHGEKSPEKVLVVDCISRALFLDQKFEQELEEVTKSFANSDPAISPEGILSLGEISSIKGRTLDFYNKTIVVGAFYN